MLFKYIITFLFCVYQVLSDTDFIKKGQRAEIFELTDNEVALFKIYLPNDEFTTLKQKALMKTEDSDFFEIFDGDDPLLALIKFSLQLYLDTLKFQNYRAIFPNFDFNKELPELKVDENGYSNIDTDEIYEEYDFNLEHHNSTNPMLGIIIDNPKFNLIHVCQVLNNAERNDKVQVDENFIFMLSSLSNFNSNNDGKNVNDITAFEKRNINIDDISNEGEVFQDKNTKNYIENKKDVEITDDNKFKTKNASMVVKVNGIEKSFKKVTLSLGGIYSREFSKPGYNIKIGGKTDLFGRKQFKLRSDCNEPTFLRTKLISDIHDHLELKSVSANFVNLYINDENMGLYILSDAYKPSWAEFEYGDVDSTTLYQCDMSKDLLPEYSVEGCVNEDKDVTNNTEWIEFLNAVKKAESAADLEDIFEIDHFLTEMAIDYLTGAWDHFQNSHNYYLYKQPNGKWIYLSYDFDHDFGQPLYGFNVPFAQYTKKLHIIDVLILRDSSRFEKILSEVVSKVFNPATLYPRIDELKQFIKPYVELDKIPDAEGHYPGRLNTFANDFFSIQHWDANSEFTTVKDTVSETGIYGLKYWILIQYRFVCTHYHMECDAIYLDENFEYPIVKEVEYRKEDISNVIISTEIPSTSTATINEHEIITSTIKNVAIPTTDVSSIMTETNAPTTTIIESETSTPTPVNDKPYQCWAELLGYPCCSSKLTTVYAHDEYGDWSYDFSKKEWCGITSYNESESNDKDCWSEELGYPCCKGCKVYEVDSNGSWGFEINHWCGIPSYC